MSSKHRNWHGIVAVILALTILVALVGLIVVKIIGTKIQDGTINEIEATIFSTALGAAIGAIAVYLGGTDNGAGSHYGQETHYHYDKPPSTDLEPKAPDGA